MRFSFYSLAFLLTIHASAQGDAIDDLIRSEMHSRKIPGLALAIIQDGKTTRTAAYGQANLELGVPVTPETVFEIGSVTKQFTATAILLLEQDGKLSIDDRISVHLKPTPEAWKNVTIRHLLTHTSGIKSYTGLSGFELTRKLSRGQFIAAIGQHPLQFVPGEQWVYSNTGYSLLGYILETASGRDYWDFLSARIFQPLGMQATTNRLPMLVIPNRASGYEQKNGRHINRDYDLTDVFSAGAMVSTVGDLAKWNAALDNETLLNAWSKRAMWQDHRLTGGKQTGYGFGWHIGQLNGRLNIGHGGSTSGFSATLQRFPEDRLAIIILSNTDEQIATTLARKAAALCLAAARP